MFISPPYFPLLQFPISNFQQPGRTRREARLMPRPISNHGLAELVWKAGRAKGCQTYVLDDVAAAAHVTRRAISKYSNPRRAAPPSIGRVDFALAEVLGVPVDALRAKLFGHLLKTNHNHRRQAPCQPQPHASATSKTVSSRSGARPTKR
jgi:transcriptional regulator with XRE-family HTH domain